MKAIVQDRYGTAEQFELRDVPVPAPGRGEVLVRVRAAAIDRGTWHLMVGLPLLVRPAVGMRGPRQPTPGLDVAGTVVATGPGVMDLAPGDEVFGTGRATFAQFAIAPRAKLAPKPPSLSFEESAAVPVSGETALQGLTDVGRLQPGQRVLVIGASGGVGHFAVQLAKALGAEVTGVCSTTKVDAVRRLGADRVIDYRTTDIDTAGGDYDLILDINGNRPIRQLRRLLTRRGTLVIVGGEQGGRVLGGLQRQVGAVALSPFVSHRLTFFVAKETTASLERLAEYVARGKVRPLVDRVYPLAEAGKAMDHYVAGHATGKVVLTMGEPD